jgi:hypothetical protein
MKLQWLLLLAVLVSTPALSYPAPYTCTRNFYVATTGVDNATCGSSTAPCATIQGANNNIALTAGDCVNVAAGTYNTDGGIVLNKGGSSNQANGYVTYKGAPNQASIINYTANSLYYGIQIAASYVAIDGFEIKGNNNIGYHGIQFGGDSGTANPPHSTNGRHHFIVINNLVHDTQGGGIAMINGDYAIIASNTIYNCANTDIYHDSGISIYEPHALASFSSSLPWDTQHYHIQVIGNVVHDCKEVNTGSDHTDGNGIIMDDWQWGQSDGVIYPYRGLIAFNVAYNNGGGGIYNCWSPNTDWYNNVAYGNGTDTTIGGRGDLACYGCRMTVWQNNIGYKVSNASNSNVAFDWQATPAGTGGSDVIINHTLTFAGTAGDQSIRVSGTGNDAANLAYVQANNSLLGADPHLMNVTAFNFAPLAGSPALGAGAALPSGVLPGPLLTPDGFVPLSPPNMGAFNLSGPPCSRACVDQCGRRGGNAAWILERGATGL